MENIKKIKQEAIDLAASNGHTEIGEWQKVDKYYIAKCKCELTMSIDCSQNILGDMLHRVCSRALPNKEKRQ